MRGMPAAALWRMARLDRRGRAAWSRRAIAATLRLRGSERTDTHDVGFLYGEGAAYGYDAGCRRALRPPFTARRCRALRASALAAADRLAAMIRANAPAPLLPTHVVRLPGLPAGRPRDHHRLDDECRAPGLGGATRGAHRLHASGNQPRGRRWPAALIRPDGCTSQATFSEQSTGRLFGVHTHQGISAGSTWARGQAWAILGFARLAHDARDSWAAGVARALAGCWLAKVPRRGVVRFDLDAVAGPPDSSAQAVAAAGLATLALADPPRAAEWRAAARTQLAAAERLVSSLPPLGRFGGQTYVAGGDPSDENTELPIAPLYALDARATLAR